MSDLQEAFADAVKAKVATHTGGGRRNRTRRTRNNGGQRRTRNNGGQRRTRQRNAGGRRTRQRNAGGQRRTRRNAGGRKSKKSRKQRK